MKEGNALSLPKGWGMKKLGEVAKAIYGYTEKASFEEIGPRFLRITDIQDEGVNWETVPFCKITDADFNKYKLIDGDIVFARTGATTGKSYLVNNPPKSVFASYLIKVHINSEGLLPEYLFLFFQTKTYWDSINEGISGSAQGGFNASKLSDLYIPLPPLSEQQRIVVVLDEAFATIAKAKANAEQNLKNAKELFESYLNSILYNQKWEIKELGEVCTKVEYGSSTKSTSEGKLPVLRMGNIQNGRFTWDSLVYSDNEEDNKQYLLRYNDVLFNRTNSPELVGKTAIYKGEMPAIFAGYLIRLHRKEDLLDADYLNYYLNSKMAMDYGKTVVISSVNQANINGTKLKTYPIPLPSLLEQQTIVRKLDALSAETKRLEGIYQQKINDLEELKKSVLQKAFGGELRSPEAGGIR